MSYPTSSGISCKATRKELVTLAEELQFVKAYTYLLSVRYEGKLFFSIQADTPYLLWYLPILSVLPLIENAVKHNVISKQYPLQIDIYTTNEDKLIISNKIHPKSEDSKGSGIGLKNLWGRYRMLPERTSRSPTARNISRSRFLYLINPFTHESSYYRR